MIKNSKSGIYLHIPFCHHKCGYCDFYSITSFKDIDNYLDALQMEIELYAESWSGHKFDTIYLGGGTPTVLSPESIDFIISEIHKKYSIDKDAEITVEANPGTIDIAKAKGIAAAGANRISLGVQSFIEKELKFLERIHSVQDVYDSYACLRNAGFDNISIDLISALPNQSLENIENNLREAAQLNPEHISSYSLIIEPNTPFGKREKNGLLAKINEEEETESFLRTLAVLESYGYEWYEISNFAKNKKHYSRHNNKYWNHIPYLGLGPAAHSFDGSNRWFNPRSIEQYTRMLDTGQRPSGPVEELSPETRMTEFAFLGLRQKQGIDKNRFEEMFHCRFDDAFAGFISRFDDSNWLVNNQSFMGLTRTGLPLCDEIATYLQVEDECVS